MRREFIFLHVRTELIAITLRFVSMLAMLRRQLIWFWWNAENRNLKQFLQMTEELGAEIYIQIAKPILFY